MFRYNERPANTDLYARIKLAPMTATERQVAINALNDAEAIVDGIVWAKNAVRKLVARLTAKPAGLKHSFKH